jgi:predicted permease
MGSRRSDDDFRAEIQAHIRLEMDRLISEGLSPKDAEAAARRTFGNVTAAEERFYQSQRWMWLDQLRQDLRYGFRSLSKSPGFTLAAALTIALGIGANTAVFSLLDAVLLRSLPVENPKELIFLEASGSAGRSGAPPYPYFSRLRSETRTLSGLAAFSVDEGRFEIDGRPEQVMGQVASENYFSLLGIKPLLGRVFSAEDARLNPPVAVISERYWRRRFGADPAVIGKTIRSGAGPLVIVGVTPAAFFGLQPGTYVDITIPISSEGTLVKDATALWLHGIVGRLKSGSSLDQARAEADVLYRSFMSSSSYPADLVAQRFHHMEADSAARGAEGLRRRFTQPLYALVGIAALVLLLAVANIANLLLSRGIARSREFAIRLATGAGGSRILRQLLTETMLLFLLGGLPGVALARWGFTAVDGLFREGRRAVEVDATLNWRVLAFSFAITLASGLIAGLFPAWRAFRLNHERAIREANTRAGESRGASRLAQGLVSFQVGLSMVLLVGALLFAGTLRSLRNFDPGFRHEGVLTLSMRSPEGYTNDRSMALWSRALETVRLVSGVRSAAVANYTPLSGRDRGALVQVRGYQPATSQDATVHTNQVSEGYFESLGMTLMRGRLLSESDAQGAPKAVVINEAAARKFFAARDPLGESLEFIRNGTGLSYRIVGVVRDASHISLREEPQRFAFLPMRQPRDMEQRVTLVIRTGVPGRELDLLPAVRSTIASVDPGILISDVITMSRQFESTLLTERLLAGLSIAFGLLALLLAAVGLFGVLSYRVSRQRHAIGIRIALGASPRGVVGSFLWESTRLVAAGLLVGLPFAIIGARGAEKMLWGVKAGKPAIYAGACLLLAVVGLLSAYVPACRAAAVDPAEVLRQN